MGEPDATDGSPAEGSVNGAVVTVTGETPVLLSGNADSDVAVLAGRNLKKGETVELLERRAGFVREEGGALLPADADLNDMKRGLPEVSRPSIASRTYLALSPDDYALHLQSENLLVADILADAEVVPQTRENARLESLSTSVLSTFGTLFTADDLLVDTILAADPAAKKEGPFAAARAGRWGIDADSRMTENVVSGLLGFAGRVADIRSGAFLEVGTGHIKTRTGTKDGVVNGSGTHNYAGAGVFLDHPVEAIGLTLTGYLKGGVVSSDFRAPLLSDDASSSDFDRSALYWGAHLGAYRDVASGRWTLRPYVAYHYDAIEGRSVRVKGVGEVESADVHYGRVDAHRVRAGTLVSHPTSRTGRFILRKPSDPASRDELRTGSPIMVLVRRISTGSPGPLRSGGRACATRGAFPTGSICRAPQAFATAFREASESSSVSEKNGGGARIFSRTDRLSFSRRLCDNAPSTESQQRSNRCPNTITTGS